MTRASFRETLRTPRLGLIALVAGAFACDTQAPTAVADPGAGSASAIATQQFNDLQDTLTVGPLRVEIRLYRDGLVAREIEVEDETDGDEEIEGRVMSIERSGDGGVFVLEPGAVRVQFGVDTRFRFDDGDSDGVTEETFLARVQQRLDAGDLPVIDAERRAASEPQDPDDPDFLARRIELEDDDREDDNGRGTKLELFIDGDNVIPNDTPPPDGWLRVLGLDIEVRLDGTTEVEVDDDDRDDDGDHEFEAFVESVSVDDSTVTLATGQVIRIVAATRFDDDDDDHDDDGRSDHPRSLGQIAEALALGLRVEAEGEGQPDPNLPDVIVADEIEFEIEDDREQDFEGRVETVDLEARTVTLEGGMVIRIASFTEWDDDDHLRTLEEVADAVTSGDFVEADGEAVPLDDGTFVAVEIEFERDDD